ncbi:hypothetical protein PENSPDRAFT_659139 [Peniophora sp. CONT]|nr:hypothetical protein PENSPDRAFT_659139 [Peniophora sp. CONT]
MVALSPRFTALAVLCSVAALTLPHADAAVMGIRPAVVRTTHDDSAYVAPPAYGAGSTQNKRFGGAHDSMFATEAIWNARYARRPLSGLAGIDEQNLPRQGYHDKVVRSVYIEGKEGASYLVRPSKRSLSQQHFNSAEWKRQHSAEWKRQEVTGVPGSIEIMSPTADPSHPLQRIASLVLAQANATDSTNGTFVLNASPDDQTQMFLVPMVNATTVFNSTEDIAITLQIPVFDAASAATQAWCATFDPAPPTPASMTAEKCLDPAANGMDGIHKSQVFSFNTVTGAVRPLWANGTSSDADGDSDAAPTAQQSAFVDPQTPDDASIASVTDFEAPIRRQEAQAPFASSSSSAASSTTSPASTSSVTSAASSTATSSSDFSSGSFGGSPAQDVTLVFVPSEPQINAVAAQDVPSSSSASSSIVSATRSASRASSTPSTTMSSTAYPTMGSSSTETASASTAAAFEDAAVESSSFSSSVASTSSAASASGSAAPSSFSSTMAPQPTIPVFRPLNVEVVPEAVDAEATPTLALPSSSASSSASATGSATVASSSASASASPSLGSRAEDESATPPYTWMFKRDD